MSWGSAIPPCTSSPSPLEARQLRQTLLQVVGHDALGLVDQWDHSAVVVRPLRLLPLVLRAAQQQERWVDMARPTRSRWPGA